MAARKEYEECIEKENLIETGIADEGRAKELLNLTKHRESFWEELEEDAAKEYGKKYPSLFLEGYYEIVKELLTAITCLDGWKATNHECLFAYIKKNYKDKLEMDLDFLLLLKDLRNDIDYRGARVGYEKWESNKLRIRAEIKALKDYIKERLKKEKE